MYISKLGFIYFKDNKFEDGALVDGELVNRSFFPSASPRPHLLPKLDNEGNIPFSFLFHKRSETIKDLLWKTTASSTKRTSTKKKNLRKAILNCPPEDMLDLLKSQGLLNDDEPISSALKLKPKLPSIPSSTKKNTTKESFKWKL